MLVGRKRLPEPSIGLINETSTYGMIVKLFTIKNSFHLCSRGIFDMFYSLKIPAKLFQKMIPMEKTWINL